MRDPNRIPEMINLLFQAWIASPDMRLTQLVSSAATLGGWKQHDPFHCEDDKTLAGLTRLVEGDVE